MLNKKRELNFGQIIFYAILIFTAYIVAIPVAIVKIAIIIADNSIKEIFPKQEKETE